MTVFLDEQEQRTRDDMHNAEKALGEMGFPQEQWTLIKEYILNAIMHNQINFIKRFEVRPEPKVAESPKPKETVFTALESQGLRVGNSQNEHGQPMYLLT